MSSCHECGHNFQVAASDNSFYSRLAVPPPTLCPSCRLQRRTVFRNERYYHHCHCELCGKQTVSTYPEKKSFPVYCSDCWWSDRWQVPGEGRYNFSESFFGQFAELKKRVPRLALFNQKSENSLYTNHCEQNRNCYLCVTTFGSENILYSRKVYDCENCLDCHWIINCSGCYELFHSQQCYECWVGDELQNSANCYYCSNLTSCKNCILCHNLTHKEYFICNQSVSPETFQHEKEKLALYSHFARQWGRFHQMREEVQVRNLTQLASEDCHGDYLTNCCNCQQSYYLTNVRDTAYALEGSNSTDVYDAFGFGVEPTELCLEVMGILGCYNVCFSDMCYHCRDVYYSDLCFNSHDLFGCIGLNHREYCIFNTQYSPEQYHQLRSRIIEQMQRSGEWGEFFPIWLSPFAYNETVAFEYFPLPRLDVLQNGWIWAEEEKISGSQTAQASTVLPDSLSAVQSDITDTVLLCVKSKRPYRIQPAELKFYQQQGLPLARLHPDVRWTERCKYRNAPVLLKRSCNSCQEAIFTSYDPERPEKVLCPSCYQKLMF